MRLVPDNLPTPKQEVWKYTNLARALPENLSDAGQSEERVIHLKKNEDGGTQEISWRGEAEQHHTPVLKITLEEGARLTLIENFTGEGSYWTNMEVDIQLGKNAQVRHIRFQEESDAAVHTTLAQVTLEEGAEYEDFNFTLGARLSRYDVSVELTGDDSRCFFNGVNLLTGDQHGDSTIVVNHRAANSHSNQFYHSVLDEKARGVFQGKVHIDKGAQKSTAYQLSKAILLSPLAEMDTKPELEIYADDVQCSHGATTGALDDEPLFYMRSRGIGEDSARALLLEAFAVQVAEKLTDTSIREQIKEKIKSWLHSNPPSQTGRGDIGGRA